VSASRTELPADVTLRQMQRADVAALMPLERALFGDEAWTQGMFDSELAEAATRWYLVAESRGIIGYAGLCAYADEAYVQTIAVAEDWWGRGVGPALLEALLAEAASRGNRTVTLEVRADNPRAQAMYHRYGFEPVGVRRRYYQPSGTDAVVMQRRGDGGRPALGPAR
jgi:ribosomal-protein-alanine N-acetyltransferase